MITNTSIAGINLKSYVYNAAGPDDSTLDELDTIARSGSACITMKTCTINPRKGNPEPRYVDLPNGTFQSMGLPNLGYKKYLEFASNLKKKYQKPIAASVAGFEAREYTFLVEEFQKSKADLIELNLSCPNLVGFNIFGYDEVGVKNILDNLPMKMDKPVGLKLPPFLEAYRIEEMAKIINNSPVSFVTCTNSVGNSLVIDWRKETTVIKPKDGFGGLAGEFIKPIALSNVRLFRKYLNSKISVIGVGGILTGSDAFEFLLAGADAVQIASTFKKEGPSSFGRIDNELGLILKEKDYKTVSDAKSKLKNL